MEEEKQKASRSRWFFIVFFLAVATSVFATFCRVFIARDYFVEVETTCSPELHACFAKDTCDTEDGTCGEGDTPTATSYYKKVERKAYSFPEVCASSVDESSCDFSCREGESDCTETYCSEAVTTDGETCVGPGAVPDSSTPQIESPDNVSNSGGDPSPDTLENKSSNEESPAQLN